jgi:hypothetical protein
MRILPAALLLALAVPLAAAVQTWNHVTLVDAMCAASIKANPDGHTTECALHCGAEGMGLLTADGAFLKFDDAGTKQALVELKGTKKKDHLRATVIGERSGDSIKVQSLKLD